MTDSVRSTESTESTDQTASANSSPPPAPAEFAIADDITVESLPRVYGDDNQLRQVFQNLIANALEYAGDEAPTITIGAERTPGRYRVFVRDDGLGIDAADSERVFDVFQRLHSRQEHAGTGIGLALCRRTVERHDGEIWVESDPGDGSTFWFTVEPAPAE